MELQNYINNNDDYLKCLRKNNISVSKNKEYNVYILKCYRNKEYDYEKNPWMKYCRGAIIDADTNKLLCVPPAKSNEIEDLNEIINNYDTTNKYEPLIDGTMINMFYKDNKWVLCTRSSVGAKNSWDGKVPFYKLFTSIQGTEWYSELKEDHCYSFVFQHIQNRIVTPVTNNAIYLIESYDMGGDVPIISELPLINGITNIIRLTGDDLKEYLKEPIFFSIKGLTVKDNSGKRTNWINPRYTGVLGLKMNNNNKFLNYMESFEKNNLNEYLYYYPEDTELYTRYYHKMVELKDRLYQLYCNIYIFKQNTLKDSPYVLKPLLYDIHGDYLRTKEKINREKVHHYVNNLPHKKLLFTINRL